MPITFKCRKCGKTLLTITYKDSFKYETTKEHSWLYNMLLNEIGDKCPYCGSKFLIPPAKIEIT